MTTFVLLHGAFRGPWAWDRVGPILRAEGHDVITPDLTDPTADLRAYIGKVAAVFDSHDLHDATLVGHSQGGFVARAASQVIAERLERLLYLDAPVPRHGQRAFDFRPAGSPEPAFGGDEVIDPRPVTAGDGLSEEDAAWINERLVGQPVAPSLEPVVLDDPEALAIAETFVFFDRTPAGFPCSFTRAELDQAGTPYLKLDAPHDAIVTHPAEVAALITG